MEGDDRAKRHIALIGLPGVGKSTVGMLVARLIGRPFFDSDTALGLAPAHRVERDATLDAAERTWFERVAGSRQAAVIAAPAAVLTTGIDESLSSGLWIVWLDASPGVLAARLRRDGVAGSAGSSSDGVGPSTPGEPDPGETLTSMAQRLCDLRIDVDGIDGVGASRSIVARWRVRQSESTSSEMPGQRVSAGFD